MMYIVDYVKIFWKMEFKYIIVLALIQLKFQVHIFI